MKDSDKSMAQLNAEFARSYPRRMRVLDKQARHDLSARAMQAITETVNGTELGGGTFKEYVTRMPNGSDIARMARELILARNYESGQKPGDIKEALEALMEGNLNQGSMITTHQEIRTAVDKIDRVITQAVANERGGRGVA